MNLMYKWHSFAYFLESMERLGFESIALWGGPPHFSCDYISYTDCGKLRREIEKKKLNIRSFLVTSTGYRYQIATEEKEFYEKSFLYFLNGIQACEELGCQYMGCNSGWGYVNRNREEAWKRSREMLSRLADEAQKRKVILTMESLKRIETNLVFTLEDTKRMYEEIHSPAFQIMADTGAIAYQGENLRQWFTTFGSSLKCMHFVDSMHQAWGDGESDLPEMMDTIMEFSYEGVLALETAGQNYFQNPYLADKKNMEALAPYLE